MIKIKLVYHCHNIYNHMICAFGMAEESVQVSVFTVNTPLINVIVFINHKKNRTV